MNEEQQKAIDCIRDGYNVFLTGPAGVGKSHILNGIPAVITATTGCSAFIINGQTLHRWAGIHLGDGTAVQLYKKVLRNNKSLERWMNVQRLVIDEVSMLSPELLEKLDYIARRIREPDLPFGGIQLILSGDFCQLPPVKCEQFCFETDIWKSLNLVTVYLTKIIRQTDINFQNILNEIRLGYISEEGKTMLRSRLCSQQKESIIKPTKLFSRRDDVADINNEELIKIKEKKTTYHAKSEIIPSLRVPKHVQLYAEHYSRNCQADDQIILAPGAQVMLLANLDQDRGLVNGSRGVVKECFEHDVVVTFSIRGELIDEQLSYFTWESSLDGYKVFKTQIPLKLAYAITVHKCQGMSLDCVELDLGNSIFEYGQFYTALSRCRSLDGIYISKLKFSRVKCNEKVKEFYVKLK